MRWRAICERRFERVIGDRTGLPLACGRGCAAVCTDNRASERNLFGQIAQFEHIVQLGALRRVPGGAGVPRQRGRKAATYRCRLPVRQRAAPAELALSPEPPHRPVALWLTHCPPGLRPSPLALLPASRETPPPCALRAIRGASALHRALKPVPCKHGLLSVALARHGDTLVAFAG